VATEWDFVEAPSQLLEEWAWDPGVLARFAKHAETGEEISKDLVARMRQAKEVGEGIAVRQQMFYAALSLQYHLQDPKNLDLLTEMKSLQQQYAPFKYLEGSHFYTSFAETISTSKNASRTSLTAASKLTATTSKNFKPFFATMLISKVWYFILTYSVLLMHKV
jgi:Zn-dependent oligopeptidase